MLRKKSVNQAKRRPMNRNGLSGTWMPYLRDLKTLRVGAGLKMAQVARAIKPEPMTPDTISRIEKGGSAPESTLRAIIHALNALHYDDKDKSLDPAKLISEKPRK